MPLPALIGALGRAAAMAGGRTAAVRGAAQKTAATNAAKAAAQKTAARNAAQSRSVQAAQQNAEGRAAAIKKNLFQGKMRRFQESQPDGVDPTTGKPILRIPTPTARPAGIPTARPVQPTSAAPPQPVQPTAPAPPSPPSAPPAPPSPPSAAPQWNAPTGDGGGGSGGDGGGGGGGDNSSSAPAEGGGMMDKATDALGAMGKVNAALGVMTTVLKEVSSPMTKIIGVFGEIRGAVTALGSAAATFVEKANPALVQRFNYAADDLTASMGKMLIPVLQFATKQVRGVADVFFALAGPVQKLANSVLKPLGTLFDDLIDGISPLVDGVGVFIEVIADLVTAITTTVGEVVLSIGKLIWDVLGPLYRAVAPFFGFGGVKTDSGKSISGGSVGAAVRNVQTGSVESFQSRAMSAAFGLGTASSEERTSAAAENILTWLKDFGGRVANFPKEIGDAVWEQVKQIPGVKQAVKVAEAQAEVGRSVANIGIDGKAAGRWLEEKQAALNRVVDDPMGAVARLYGR